ncbi:MAG: serine/threonine-protein kinase, partial [Myxococcota bacterium]
MTTHSNSRESAASREAVTVRDAAAALQSLSSERRQFHMKACLGRGGFGEVYRATMVSAGGVRTEVAVKVLHVEVDPNSQAVQRLRDEGRMLGAIRHPSVLKVHDLVLLDGRVALVTEFVEGQDLDKALQGSDPVPLRAMVELTAKIAEALDAAFNAAGPTGEGRLELVHRDIKPANIRLGLHGEVKLLDFGIARATNVQREARTETNAMLGSYLYMAPERFLENTASGPAVDVYALGLTLFEGITRRRLFGDMSLKELYLLILDDQKYDAYLRGQLETIPKEVPHQVVALLYRMLGLTPEGRPDHQTLAKTCFQLTDQLTGKTLARWARERVWPPPRTVRGMLDGSVITETAFSRSASYDLQLPLPSNIDSGSIDPADRGRTPPPTGAFDTAYLLRTATATLDRPGVVVGVGFGLFGMAAVIGVVFGLLMVGSAALYVYLSPPDEALVPAPMAPISIPGSNPVGTTPLVPAPAMPEPTPI